MLAVLGYPGMAEAADATPLILPLTPAPARAWTHAWSTWCGPGAARRVPDLPPGSGWLLVEVTGDSEAAALSRRAPSDVGGRGGVGPGGHRPRRTRPRSGGSASRAPAWPAGRSRPPAYPGWEDSAVPPLARPVPARTGRADGRARPGRHARTGTSATAACTCGWTSRWTARTGWRCCAASSPTRPPWYQVRRVAVGRARRRPGRSELLPVMYSAAAIKLFGQVKGVFDPEGVLNPGVLVDPRPADADVRATALADHRREPGGKGRSARRPARAGLPGRRRRLRRRRCTAARGWASASPPRRVPAG